MYRRVMRDFLAALRTTGRVGQLGLQSVVDFLIEDSCVICGRTAASPGCNPHGFEGPARHLLEPVTCRYLRGTLSITNHPVCRDCAVGFEVARNVAVLDAAIGPSGIQSARNERCRQKGVRVGAVGPDSRETGGCLLDGAAQVTVVAPFMINDNVLKIIHLVKFSRYDALIPPVARAIGHVVRSFGIPSGRDAVLVPTPMEPVEFRRRGFNQAERIAAALGRDLRIPLATDTLKKTRRTAPQSRTKHAERAQNVRRAFTCVGEMLCDKHVLLVDDLVTTGATAASCAAALDRGGVRRVTVLCFGRAV
ncbi:MAG: ComF family protein [Candidatus Latescibacterota bacterium]|nr:MAG: ComF family protein [Candidatus Latescibacterota bacterium]